METNNYGLGKERNLDINGNELPKLHVTSRKAVYGNDTMLSVFPEAEMFALACDWHHKNGRKPNKAVVPMVNCGVKCLGRMIPDIGWMTIDIEYDSQAGGITFE